MRPALSYRERSGVFCVLYKSCGAQTVRPRNTCEILGGTVVGKKLAIVLSLVLAVCLGIALWQLDRQEQARQELYQALELQTRPLRLQRNSLERELQNLEKDDYALSQVHATEEILVVELDAALYEQMFPVMQQAGVCGVLALSQTEFFDLPGKITRAQFDELLDAGWSYCLSWDGSAELAPWLDEMIDLLDQEGLYMPSAVYCAPNCYSTDLDPILAQYQVDVVIHHGEESLPLMVSKAEEGIWRLGAKVWNYGGVKIDLENLVSRNGNLVFTVSFDASRNDTWSKSSFQSMLEFISSYVASDRLMVTDFQTARTYHTLSDEDGGTLDLEQRRAELQAQIDALEEQINAIYEQEG